MGETLLIFLTTFNRCVQVEARADHLSADSGVLLLREIMELTGIVEYMSERLVDSRSSHMIKTISWPIYCAPTRCCSAKGWRNQDDTDRLRHDPSLRMANDIRRGNAALQQDNVLPSQPTLSSRWRTCTSSRTARRPTPAHGC